MSKLAHSCEETMEIIESWPEENHQEERRQFPRTEGAWTDVRRENFYAQNSFIHPDRLDEILGEHLEGDDV